MFNNAFAGGNVTSEGEDGVAIKGYEPVAYFESQAATPGSSAHALTWQDATWHFSSAENKAEFAASPKKRAPQYGAYCAIGTRVGLKIDSQPELFKVVDGKLYLNSSEKAHGMWLKDIPGHIQVADENWLKIETKTAAEFKAAHEI